MLKKKRDTVFFFLTIFLLCQSFGFGLFGQVTGGTGGNGLCVGSGYTTLTPIIISETVNNGIDINPTSAIKTLNLTFSDPSFEFEPNVGSFAFTGTGSTGVLISGSVTSTQISVSIVEIDDTNAGALNSIEITGIRVRAIAAVSSTQYILRSNSGVDELLINGFNAPSNITSAMLASYDPPNITGQPVASQSVCEGDAANFSVSASGTGLSYQWKKNSVDIPLATSSIYSIGSTVSGDVGTYTVVINGGTCSSGVTGTGSVLTINEKPEIIPPPVLSQSVCVGQSVSFSVNAGVTTLPTYQWRKGGVDIVGATGSSYTIPGVVVGDAAIDYDVVVSGTCAPNITSTQSTLVVNTLPAISAQPVASQSVCEGSAANFSVVASGTALIYQWKKNGIDISSATSSTYSIGTTVSGDAGTYTVAVSGTCSPGITSTGSFLTINEKPEIITQPVSTQSVCVGQSVTFNVGAGVTTLPTYQWRRGGVNISGATNPSYTIPSVVVGDAAPDYDVVISGTCTPNITSTQSALVVNTLPAISIQPIASQSVCEGSTANFSVTASGTALTYQWRRNGLDLSGAVNPTYSIGSTISADAGMYTVVVRGTCTPGVISSGSALIINEKPEITIQPVLNQSACVGQGITLNVTAGVTSNPTYQWRKGGSPIVGATSSIYTKSSVGTGDAGNYDVVVSGTCSPAVTSTASSLTVNTPPTSFATSQTICSGSTSSVNISNPNGVAGTSFTWSLQSSNNITGASGGSGPVIAQTINSADGISSGFVTYQIVGSASGCSGPSFAITISVLPIPDADASNVTICSRSNSNVSITNPNGVLNTTFSWSRSGFSNVTGTTSVGNGPSINQTIFSTDGTSSGFVTYAITPTANGCNGSVKNVTINVNPIATVNAGIDFQVCEDQIVQLSGSYGGSTSIVTWSGGSGASQFTNINSPTSKYNLTSTDITNGTITLTLQTNDPDGLSPSGPCTTISDQVVIKVNKLPMPSIFGLAPTYAENDPVVTMAGFPLGGTFTGPGVQSGTNNFDPGIANFGNNLVKYTYSDPSTACSNFVIQSVLVNQLTTIDFEVFGQTDEVGAQIYVCGNSGRHELLGSPNVSVGKAPTQFTSSAVGLVTKIGGKYFLETDGILPGTYQVMYTYTNSSSATNNLIKNIVINASPLAKILTANACVVDNVAFNDGTTIPNNNTGSALTGWDWDFGDSFQSTLQNTKHVYGASGNYVVKLIALTNQGCSNTTTMNIRIGNPPKVNFGWTEICSGVSTKFISKTHYGISGPKYFSWNFDDGAVTLPGDSLVSISTVSNTTGTYAAPSHTYSKFKLYNVKLTIETNDGCIASKTKKVFILDNAVPTFTKGYFESFENGPGTWIRTSSASDTSWVFGKPTGTIIDKASSGTNAWWTGANAGTYFNNEKSEVIGPCLNLNNLDRPMVSLNYWSDAQDQFDGTVFQYSVDGGMSWLAIGKNNGWGIGWYKNSAIVSNPGNQPLGQYGWSGSSGGWKNARFNLDEIPINSRDQVIFRIAFASNSDNPSGSKYNGFAFDDVYIGEKKRNVLIEHFTNIPNVSAAQYFDKLFVDQTTLPPQKKKSDFFKIQYHVDNPKPDSINKVNQADPATRAFYYGVPQPPYSIMDGIMGNYFETVFNGDHVWIDAEELDRRALEDSPFEIKADILSGTDNYLKANLKISYTDSVNTFSSPVIIQAALIESAIGSLKNVVRKLVLQSEGKLIASSWTRGTVVDVPVDYTVDVHITNPNQLLLVTSVQDKTSHRIYQSQVVPLPRLVGPQVVGLPENPVDAEIRNIDIYPNPVKDILNFEWNSKQRDTYTWQIVDQRGITMFSGTLNNNLSTLQQMDLSGLADGIYFVAIGYKNDVVMRKMIAIMKNN